MSLTELWPISIPIYPFTERPGRVVQSVTCLTADPGLQVRSRLGHMLSWRLIMK